MCFSQNLKGVLQQYGVYDYLIQQQQDFGKLSKKGRSKLIHTIVEHTVFNYIWIEQQEFVILFDMIKTIFKNEDMDKYFIPISENRKSAGGQLFTHFKYRHDILTKECGIRKNKKKKDSSKEKSDIVPETSDIAAEVLRKELIGRSEPWQRIVDDWKKSCYTRRQEILSMETNDIIARWPKFKNKRGIDLVCVFVLILK